MNAHEIINDTLVRLIHEVWRLEEKTITTGEFAGISNNDMHIIEAIGLGVGNTMSAVAKKLGITAGSLTTAINGLVNKKYVIRERGEVDRRVVYVFLSEKGKRAFYHHAKFHEKMTEAVMKTLNETEISVLTKGLQNLASFFSSLPDKF